MIHPELGHNGHEAIADVQGYKEAQKRSTEATPCDVANPERSELFRHKKDFEVFAELVEKLPREGRPLKFLEIGVGNKEEPVSFLAAAQSKLGGRKLEEALDMNLVEIRSRDEVAPKSMRLGKQLFDPQKPREPKMFKSSFVLSDGEYEPNDEIKDFLGQTIDNPFKSHFDTPVENFTRENQERFDVVCCNNVVQHMGGVEGYTSPYKNGPGDHSRYYDEVGRIADMVAINGVLFMHAPAPGGRFDTKGTGIKRILEKVPNFSSDFEEISPAVFRRIEKTPNS